MPNLARMDFTEDAGIAWLRADTHPAIPFEILNDDETPVDLTGAQIVMDIYESLGGARMARLRTSGAPAASPVVPEGTITVSDADAGVGTIDQIPPSVTSALLASGSRRKAKRWYTFEITWDASPDVVITPFGGYIEVMPDGA